LCNEGAQTCLLTECQHTHSREYRCSPAVTSITCSHTQTWIWVEFSFCAPHSECVAIYLCAHKFVFFLLIFLSERVSAGVRLLNVFFYLTILLSIANLTTSWNVLYLSFCTWDLVQPGVFPINQMVRNVLSAPEIATLFPSTKHQSHHAEAILLTGSYYALLQSLNFVLGCTRICFHAWLFKKKYFSLYHFPLSVLNELLVHVSMKPLLLVSAVIRQV